jgi:LytS/YehU family sensor histidine kinase
MHFHWNVLTYWMILAFLQTLDYYHRYRERELRASQVEAQLARAELQALRMQLHPHFLFNALNSISALMYSDVEAADSMLARLSTLLRSRLADASPPEVSLKEELESLEQYLDIERIRFADRLTVRTTIAPDTVSALVPSLVLQPLVENAIRHGIAQRESAGLIEINTLRENGSLHLEVRDNGPGLSNATLPSSGIGLSNTRERLRCLYGEAQSLELRNAARGGTVVEVVIPYHSERS